MTRRKRRHIAVPDGHCEYVDKPLRKRRHPLDLRRKNQVQWEQKSAKEKGRTTMTYTSAQATEVAEKAQRRKHAALLDKARNAARIFAPPGGRGRESRTPRLTTMPDTRVKKLAELERRIRKVKHVIATCLTPPMLVP